MSTWFMKSAKRVRLFSVWRGRGMLARRLKSGVPIGPVALPVTRFLATATSSLVQGSIIGQTSLMIGSVVFRSRFITGGSRPAAPVGEAGPLLLSYSCRRFSSFNLYSV